MPLICSHCFKHISLSDEAIQFCPYCGFSLRPDSPLSKRYSLEKEIGKGGMGEVYLAFDKKCGRAVALKKIRSDLASHTQIGRRFLKEARISCKLNHPGIIPIYSMEKSKASSYYTMPYVEGDTLKEIIKKARSQEKKGLPLGHLAGSIPALIRIFISVCQAVAYAHSKKILHRDLKLENIMIGKYGEVIILDWGLATFIHSYEEEGEDDAKFKTNEQLTRIGKVVGTISYMAPERALGTPATFQTDIYSLGVILYYLLTLRPPFYRKNLEEFRKNIPLEHWIDPIQAAPYRDVPQILSRMTQKCLQPDPLQRFNSVQELIHDLENYLEGRSEWISYTELNVKNKNDWEFQELVWIGDHLAISRSADECEWVNLMISRQSFTGNTRIEAEVSLGEKSQGIGILFNIPEASQRLNLYDGYCLRLGSDLHKNTKLMRSNVELIQASDIFLKRKEKTKIRIEKIDRTIHVYLNDTLQLSYMSYLPIIGTHIGFLASDDDFELSPLKISLGSLNLMVDCLAVPDAFLAKKDFSHALSEYRRIAYSFPDRAEGREAVFRAGLTLIEEAKESIHKEQLLEQALHEFEKLHGSPAGPLEYLGKAIVYQTLNDDEEEIKCFEIAYRRYPFHPFLNIIQEHILSRMHEVSRRQRITTYRFILLATRYFSPQAIDTHSKRIFTSLRKHWEPLFFIDDPFTKTDSFDMIKLAIPLAFWLAQPHLLGEIAEEILKTEHPSEVDFGNAIAALIELGASNFAKQKLIEIENNYPVLEIFSSLKKMIECEELGIHVCLEELKKKPLVKFGFPEQRLLLFMMDHAIDADYSETVHEIMRLIENFECSFELLLKFKTRQIWAYLLEKNWQLAGEVLYSYPVDLLTRGSSLLHFLYGCWLEATEGSEIATIHFKGLLPVTFPRSWALGSHQLAGELCDHGWFEKSFLWEKRELYRQLSLYYHCIGDNIKSNEYKELKKKEKIN